MTEKELFELTVKNCFAYAQADDKKNFMDGAMEAYELLTEQYDKKAETIERLANKILDERDHYLNDFKTLANLIKKYSD